MKKIFILSLYFVSTYALSACSHFSNDTIYVDDSVVLSDESSVIDATTKPNERCGINGISCNDSPLVNYTKTEADYRAYGERTKRDHLYTQEGVGNNLTATIQPGIENDVVVSAKDIEQPSSAQKYAVADDDLFSKTGSLDIERQNSSLPIEYAEKAPRYSKGDSEVPSDYAEEVELLPEGRVVVRKSPKVGFANKGKNDSIKVPSYKNSRSGSYQVVCEEECDDIINDDIITSEFTEESFDIADFIGDDTDDETAFKNVGGAAKDIVALSDKINMDVEIKDLNISDNTVLTWEAEEGDNLRELLTKWSNMVGWKLLWNTNRNYVLSAGVMFKGKFADVSAALIRAFARARPAPIATYYKGNRVIVVETMENENAY